MRQDGRPPFFSKIQVRAVMTFLLRSIAELAFKATQACTTVLAVLCPFYPPASLYLRLLPQYNCCFWLTVPIITAFLARRFFFFVRATTRPPSRCPRTFPTGYPNLPNLRTQSKRPLVLSSSVLAPPLFPPPVHSILANSFSELLLHQKN